MDTSGKKIFEQIEAGANLYAPATYRNYLQFFHDYVLELSPGDFIPVTAVRNLGPDQRILFAVGILPPAANVTGRLLDRSASVAATGLETASSDLPTAPAGSGGAPPKSSVRDETPPPGRLANLHKHARQILLDAFKAVMGRDPTTEELQYLHAVAWLETSYGNGWKGPMVGSNNWGAIHCPRSGQNGEGCIQYEDSYPDGRKYTVSFKSYETPKDGAADLVATIFKNRPKTAGALAGGGSIMDASFAMRREKYYGGFCSKATAKYGGRTARDSFREPDRDEGTQACAEEAITAHAELVKRIINEVAGANGDPFAMGLGSYAETAAAWGVPGAAPGGPVDVAVALQDQWANGGSANAQEAGNQSAASSGTPLNSTETGEKFLQAQALQATVTKLLLEAMAKTPPLKMLINPTSFTIKSDKITQDANWGRNGPIIEHWGDNQDKISASGKVAGFYAIDRTRAASPGLTRTARTFSESWQNLQSLCAIYRNNGVLFLNDSANPSGYAKNLSHVGSVYIYYDGTMYIGSFDTFSVTENEASPFTVEYSFEFTVRATFLFDKNDDLNNYGTPVRPAAAIPTTSSPPAPPRQQQPPPNNVKTDAGRPSGESTPNDEGLFGDLNRITPII